MESRPGRRQFYTAITARLQPDTQMPAVGEKAVDRRTHMAWCPLDAYSAFEALSAEGNAQRLLRNKDAFLKAWQKAVNERVVSTRLSAEDRLMPRLMEEQDGKEAAGDNEDQPPPQQRFQWVISRTYERLDPVIVDRRDTVDRFSRVQLILRLRHMWRMMAQLLRLTGGQVETLEEAAGEEFGAESQLSLQVLNYLKEHGEEDDGWAEPEFSDALKNLYRQLGRPQPDILQGGGDVDASDAEDVTAPPFPLPLAAGDDANAVAPQSFTPGDIQAYVAEI